MICSLPFFLFCWQDDLTTALVDQCHQSKYTVQRIIESGDDEAVVFEALNINDEIHKVLSKYQDLKRTYAVPREPESAMIPVAVEPEDSSGVGKEDALVRKPSNSQAGGTQVGNTGDMMDDFDEVVIGKNVVRLNPGRIQRSSNLLKII